MTDLHHNIPIQAAPAKVYAALATESGMQGWWTRDTKMEAKVGGAAEFGFDRRAMVFRMKIDALDAGRKVRMSCAGDHSEWAGTTLEWQIEAKEGGTVLKFDHRGWREATDFCASCNTMWGNLLFKLKTFVETGEANPQWTELKESPMPNAGPILKQYYDAVRNRDMAKARTFLDDDMVFVGLFETYPNADAYIKTFTQLMSIVTRLDVKAIIGEGDQAAIFLEMETTAPAAATTLVAEWHQVKNGKIVRAQSAFDGRPFAAMFAGR